MSIRIANQAKRTKPNFNYEDFDETEFNDGENKSKELDESKELDGSVELNQSEGFVNEELRDDVIINPENKDDYSSVDGRNDINTIQAAIEYNAPSNGLNPLVMKAFMDELSEQFSRLGIDNDYNSMRQFIRNSLFKESSEISDEQETISDLTFLGKPNKKTTIEKSSVKKKGLLNVLFGSS